MLGWIKRLFGGGEKIPHQKVISYLRDKEFVTQEEIVKEFGPGVVEALRELENEHSVVVSMMSPEGKTLYRLSRWYRRNVLKEG